MSKKQVTISDNVMSRISREHIAMKPRWYFVAGSLFMMTGLIGFTVLTVFLTNLTLFMLRTHGPMGQLRFEQMLSSFSWWIPVSAVLGLALGIVLLKKYDFSYKKNFPLLIAGFIVAVIIGAYLMDHLGINERWARQGPMRRLYQGIEGSNSLTPRGQGQGWQRNGQKAPR